MVTNPTEAPPPWAAPAVAGRFTREVVDSPALAGNPLGDPAQRPLWVYTPPGYDQEPGRRYPAVYVIQGFTGQADMWWNRRPWQPGFPVLIDQLFATAAVPPAVVALVDAWTSLGGSQFLNSPATGRYMDYLTQDVVGAVDARYRTVADRDHRALAGKSSGGYGAMVVPMLAPEVFGALATHAGDAGFELCYLADVAVAARSLRDDYEGSYDRFWEAFSSRAAFAKRSDAALLNTYAMAACYSAEPDGTVTLPFDPVTAALRDDVWARWQAHDPVRMAPRHADALRSLRAVWVDAGRSDDYWLDLGAQAFAAQLGELGVAHRFELFEGTHSGIEHRYPLALRYLVEALTP
ncbi:MAG TPA: alpha/beta hydrolase-fold protein [Acidimicrobiales bacterium]|nr:alpha/beta hydrolase-fold protein [Acidimicrobiales bacterium]